MAQLSNQVPFPALRYDRVCRTPSSEGFLLSEGDDPLGRVDLHYGARVVHALLVVEKDMPDDDMRDLVERIDEDLVGTSDRPRDDFLVTIYRGFEVGVLSDRPDSDSDEAEE